MGLWWRRSIDPHGNRSSLLLDINAGTSLGMSPANERRRYNVTTSLIGWVLTQTDPCTTKWFPLTRNAEHPILSIIGVVPHIEDVKWYLPDLADIIDFLEILVGYLNIFRKSNEIACHCYYKKFWKCLRNDIRYCWRKSLVVVRKLAKSTCDGPYMICRTCKEDCVVAMSLPAISMHNKHSRYKILH